MKKIIIFCLLISSVLISPVFAGEWDDLFNPSSDSDSLLSGAGSADSGVKAIYKDGKYLGSYLKGDGSNVSSFIPADGSDLISCVHTSSVVSCN